MVRFELGKCLLSRHPPSIIVPWRAWSCCVVPGEHTFRNGTRTSPGAIGSPRMLSPGDGPVDSLLAQPSLWCRCALNPKPAGASLVPWVRLNHGRRNEDCFNRRQAKRCHFFSRMERVFFLFNVSTTKLCPICTQTAQISVM